MEHKVSILFLFLCYAKEDRAFHIQAFRRIHIVIRFVSDTFSIYTCAGHSIDADQMCSTDSERQATDHV